MKYVFQLLLVQLIASAGSLVATPIDLRIGFAAPHLDGAPSEEEFLNQFIGQELDSLDRDLPCLLNDDPDSISSRMDRLAERLATAMDSGGSQEVDLREELAQAINLQDFVPEHGARRPLRKYSSDLGSRQEIVEILDPKNRFIYRGKRLTDQGIMQMALLVTERATIMQDERMFFQQMFGRASEHAKENQSDRNEGGLMQQLTSAAKLGSRVVESIYNWADELYLKSAFLEKIPILGIGISKLREIGRPPYEILDTVRYMQRVWSKFANELPRPGSHTRRVLVSEESKRMLKEAGMAALKFVAAKLLSGSGAAVTATAMLAKDMAIVQEVTSRCAFYLFAQLVPRSPYCLIGRKYYEEQQKRQRELFAEQLGALSGLRADADGQDAMAPREWPPLE